MKSKSNLFFVPPLILIFLKWLNILRLDILFNFHSDCRRHILLVEDIITNGHISDVMKGYPPAFHVFISNLSIISGLELKFCFYLISLILTLVFIMVIYSMLYREDRGRDKALIAIALFALVAPIAASFPRTIIYFLFVPLIILVSTNIGGSKIKYSLLAMSMMAAALTHQFSLLLLGFILVASILLLFNKSQNFATNLWTVSWLSWILGFIFYIGFYYTSVKPSINTAITHYFLEISIINNFGVYFLSFFIMVCIFFSLSLFIFNRKNFILPHILKEIAINAFSVLIFLAFFLFSLEFLYAIGIGIFRNFLILFQPPVDPFTPGLVQVIIKSRLPVFQTFSLSIGSIFFLLFSIVYMKNIRRKDWDTKTILLITFPIIMCFLPIVTILSVFLPYGGVGSKFFIFKELLTRLSRFSLFPCFLLGSILLFKFLKKLERKHMYFIIFLILLLGLINMHDIKPTSQYIPPNKAYSTGMYWLVDNTEIPQGFMLLLNRDYYKVHKFEEKYKLELLGLIDVKIKLLNKGDNRYQPLINANMGPIGKQFLIPVKYKPIGLPRIHDKEIYSNDVIGLYEKIGE